MLLNIFLLHQIVIFIFSDVRLLWKNCSPQWSAQNVKPSVPLALASGGTLLTLWWNCFAFLCTFYSWVVVYVKDPVLDIVVGTQLKPTGSQHDQGNRLVPRADCFLPEKISWVHPNKLHPKPAGRSGFRWAASLRSHVCFNFFLINTSNPHSLQTFFKLQISKPKKINIIPNSDKHCPHLGAYNHKS